MTPSEMNSIYDERIPNMQEECIACQEGLANQEAHMEEGGCLYSPSACETCRFEYCICNEESKKN